MQQRDLLQRVCDIAHSPLIMCGAASKQPGSAPDLGVVGMEKNGKQYVCTPYQPFGGGALPNPLGTSGSAAAPAGAADTSPLRFQDGGLLGLPAPAPEAAAADPSALTSAARQYVSSFRAQQPAAGPAAAQGPAADPLFADLLEGELPAHLSAHHHPRQLRPSFG